MATRKQLLSKIGKKPATKTATWGPNLVIIARAGTGKTFSLMEGLWRIKGKPTAGVMGSPQQEAIWEAMLEGQTPKTIISVAFNKDIATVLQGRVPPGCDAKTMHSLGFGVVTKTYGRCQVNRYKTQNILEQILGRDIREYRRSPGKQEVISAVERLVDLCKQNLLEGTLDDLEFLVSHYDIDTNGGQEEAFDLVPKVLEKSKTWTHEIDYCDMIWLPVINNLPLPNYDLMLVDEAQDLNRCQQELCLRVGKRIVCCGDPCQAIYGFAGADINSIPQMTSFLEERPNGVRTLPLTVTRRCGKAIVEEAKKIVPDFEAYETNSLGRIVNQQLKTYQDLVADGDMILCRCNAPLVSQCFRFISAGRKANIRGREIGDQLVNLVKKLKATDVGDLIEKLECWYQTECKHEACKKNPSESKLMNLEDKYHCLQVFTENSKTVQEVTESIQTVFSDDRTGIQLSSAHKAKGLEADNVFILLVKGAAMPHPMARKPWQMVQEHNLKYVAITRAKHALTFVMD